MTGDSATKGIRELDPDGAIGLIGAEPDPPYDRPPLSKKLWTGKPFDSIWRKTAERNVMLHLGRTAVKLDPAHHRVSDFQGESYQYDKLLLATGGTPQRLPFDRGNSGIIYFRTVADYRALRSITGAGDSPSLPLGGEEPKRGQSPRIGVIGGGFIGSEVACAIRMTGCDVVMVMPDDAICARVFPADLARFVTDYVKAKGVQVISQGRVSDIRRQDDHYLMQTQAGRVFEVECVVAGIGITPNTELASMAGLDVGQGISVDEFLRTSDPDIYAAGDVAEFYNPALGKKIRVEHEDCANKMGKQAGRNMAGAGETWTRLPFFYSDLFELGYEAIGTLDPRLEVYADWQIPPQLTTHNSQLTTPLPKGVLYYLEDQRVRGVLLWNVWDKIPVARELIAQPGPFGPENLKGRIS
jgi:NADPH-dependent 2,4-dienoyl-CoA reductase/sulfur reductase-like enzyme